MLKLLIEYIFIQTCVSTLPRKLFADFDEQHDDAGTVHLNDFVCVSSFSMSYYHILFFVVTVICSKIDDDTWNCLYSVDDPPVNFKWKKQKGYSYGDMAIINVMAGLDKYIHTTEDIVDGT